VRISASAPRVRRRSSASCCRPSAGERSQSSGKTSEIRAVENRFA
jgi:hypothetical protein